MRSAAVVVVLVGGASAGTAAAHSEGLTPYRYVVAPPGVSSEGPAEDGVSTQGLGRPGFAGTTDNQMQLTLPAGALPPEGGVSGVRVRLEQLDPAALPPLPPGLEPEGNGYRVSMTYVPTGRALDRLASPAPLSLSAPAEPTALLELVDGAWKPVRFTPAVAGEGFSSVIDLVRPGTFLQVYDPTAARVPAQTVAPRAPDDDDPGWSRSTVVIGGLLVLAAVGVAALARSRRRCSTSDERRG